MLASVPALASDAAQRALEQLQGRALSNAVAGDRQHTASLLPLLRPGSRGLAAAFSAARCASNCARSSAREPQDESAARADAAARGADRPADAGRRPADRRGHRGRARHPASSTPRPKSSSRDLRALCATLRSAPAALPEVVAAAPRGGSARAQPGAADAWPGQARADCSRCAWWARRWPIGWLTLAREQHAGAASAGASSRCPINCAWRQSCSARRRATTARWGAWPASWAQTAAPVGPIDSAAAGAGGRRSRSSTQSGRAVAAPGRAGAAQRTGRIGRVVVPAASAVAVGRSHRGARHAARRRARGAIGCALGASRSAARARHRRIVLRPMNTHWPRSTSWPPDGPTRSWPTPVSRCRQRPRGERLAAHRLGRRGQLAHRADGAAGLTPTRTSGLGRWPARGRLGCAFSCTLAGSARAWPGRSSAHVLLAAQQGEPLQTIGRAALYRLHESGPGHHRRGGDPGQGGRANADTRSRRQRLKRQLSAARGKARVARALPFERRTSDLIASSPRRLRSTTGPAHRDRLAP